jgi:hypothetical protein
MPRRYLAIVFSILCLAAATALGAASSNPIELGPVKISMDLSSMGDYKVEKDSPYTDSHPGKGYDFSYQIYPARVSNSSSDGQVNIEVHQMDSKEELSSSVMRLRGSSGLEHCVKESGLLGKRATPGQEAYTIDGREGMLMKVDEGGDEPRYIAAYSPDLESGSGTIVCIISSDLPWNATEGLLQSVRTQVV